MAQADKKAGRIPIRIRQPMAGCVLNDPHPKPPIATIPKPQREIALYKISQKRYNDMFGENAYQNFMKVCNERYGEGAFNEVRNSLRKGKPSEEISRKYDGLIFILSSTVPNPDFEEYENFMGKCARADW